MSMFAVALLSVGTIGLLLLVLAILHKPDSTLKAKIFSPNKKLQRMAKATAEQGVR